MRQTNVPFYRLVMLVCERWYRNSAHKCQMVGEGIMDCTDPCEHGAAA